MGSAVTDDPASRGPAFKDHFSVVADAYAAADFRAQIQPHWPPERAQIDAHYADYDWPFPVLPTPQLWLEAEWSLPQFVRYLSSLSASTRCLADTGDRSGRAACPGARGGMGRGRRRTHVAMAVVPAFAAQTLRLHGACLPD